MDADQAGKRLVVIEDHEGIARLIEDILSSAGYRVETVPSREDMDDLVHQGIDLIILELASASDAPYRDLDEIVTRPATRGIPVICMSSLPMLSEAALARDGVVGFIKKPFDVEELLKSVESTLS